MILKHLLGETRTSLAAGGVEEAPLEAELLLMKALGLNRASLYAYPERPVTREELNSLSRDLSRRLTGEPWSYISGHREFYGLDMAVGPGIFVPRPETELLVDLAIRMAGSLPRRRPLRIADVGTGSGAIAVALALHLPHAIVYATDVSTLALETARRNCMRHKVQERVVLMEGNLLGPVPEPVDLVVSNPPYIPREDIPYLPPEVRWEPPEALDGGVDGLEVIRSLITQALERLRQPGGLLVETSPQQADEVRFIAENMLPGHTFEIFRDLAGGERALWATIA
ncbi:MAG: peptide chain release factor N(5)-glutamine methyltransferase [Chloroflexi bacterium]|nr:peptide chain release factor N(5)-glutamine methyltransferase [Chloroflexota bacterium]